MPDLRRIQSRSGAPFTVAGQYAPQFQGLLYDLEDAGYAVNPQQSGGYNPRNIAGTNTPSNHAFGRAVDINWTDNARGTKGKIPADLAKTLAAKHGMTWGGLWKNPDPMHFEVANAASPAVSQRSMTNYAGLGGPKEAEPPKGEPMASPFAFDFSNLPAAEYLAKRGQMETSALPPQQSAPPPSMMGPMAEGGERGILDSFLNPVTQAGLAILGSPTRDVAQGMQFLDPNRDLDRKYKEALTQKALREAQGGSNKYGKTGAVFQGPDGNFYTMQFAEDGTRKVEPVQYPGRNGASPVALTPARGVDVVGDEVYNRATGAPVRDVSGAIAGAERSKAVGKGEGEGYLNLPKAESALKAYETESKFLIEDVDRALGQAGPWTTGFAGNLGSFIAGTPAHDLSKTVTGIQARLGFETLQQMRDNSPTGGALGSITERELELLQSTWGSLMQSQSEAQFRHYMGRIKQIKQEYAVLKREAYQRDVARFGAANVPNPDTGGAPAQPAPQQKQQGKMDLGNGFSLEFE
jgi:hypothetical protein